MKLVDPKDFAGSWTIPRYIWMNYEPKIGDRIIRPHPFTRMEQHYDVGPPHSYWRPGVWNIDIDDSQPVAHDMGKVQIDILGIMEVRGYPRRIGYTRIFTTPNSGPLKRSGMIVHAIGKLRQVCAGV